MDKLRKFIRQTLSEFVTPQDIKSVDDYADDLFSDVGVDVKFSDHFMQRVNDYRNKQDITPLELKWLYDKAHDRYADMISKLPSGSEKVFADKDTQINIPFVVAKNNKTHKKDLINKTIMRKKDFASYAEKLFLENALIDTILDKISTQGMDSLSPMEKEYLNKTSKGEKDEELEDLLSIDTGYVFRTELSNGESVSFEYDSTESDDTEIRHVGNVMFNGEQYWGEIYSEESGYSYFTLHDGNDYVEFNDDIEEELNVFFGNIATKIEKTLGLRFDEDINEDISRDEASSNIGSIKTIADGKRNIGFISWMDDEIEELLKKNNIKSIKVPSNPYGAYIIYKPGAEAQANELLAIAEKYNGFLSVKATKKDSIRIGQLLGYKQSDIDAYVQKNYGQKPNQIREIFQNFIDKSNYIKRNKNSALIKLPIDAVLKNQHMPEDYLVQRGKNEIGNRIDKAKLFLQANPEKLEPSAIGITNGKISFQDGRHRLIAAKELGATDAYFEIDKRQLPELKKIMGITNENIDVPINIGDEVLGGKFKNKKITVKNIDKNEKGDITINDKPLLRFRTIQENFIPSKNFHKAIVKVSDLYVESDNMIDAYYKSKNGIGPASRSTGKPLTISKLLDGSLILLDGHHRIADAIKYLDKPTLNKILNLKFEAIIHNEKYNSIEDMPNDFQYWMSFIDWADSTLKNK